MEKLIKTLLPPQCLFCKHIGKSFCSKCLSKETLLDIPRCLFCDNPSFEGLTHKICAEHTRITDIFSAYVYKDNIRECIRRSKYQDLMFDSLKDLTKASLYYSYKVGNFYQECFVVSVPTTKKRLNARKFHHVDLISKEISKFYKIPFLNKSLFRVKQTIPLSELSRHERSEALKGAFIADPQKIAGKNILLVDDICTTGTTLINCAEALFKAGAAEVRCFTLSRVPLSH
jgi:competence protein ComFC